MGALRVTVEKGGPKRLEPPFHGTAAGVSATGELTTELEDEISEVPMDKRWRREFRRIEEIQVSVFGPEEIPGTDVAERTGDALLLVQRG